MIGPCHGIVLEGRTAARVMPAATSMGRVWGEGRGMKGRVEERSEEEEPVNDNDREKKV